jgi:hypothetical protein
MLLGTIQSLFEGAMFTFVFMWTPALSVGGKDLPHGWIFASFMLCVMIGSSLFKFLVYYTQLENSMRYLFLFAAASLFLPVISTVRRKKKKTTTSFLLL